MENISFIMKNVHPLLTDHSSNSNYKITAGWNSIYAEKKRKIGKGIHGEE